MTPLRIQRKRTAGWRMPPNTVYVGRAGSGHGRWGNPFRVAPAFESEDVKVPEITAASAVTLYSEWMQRALEAHECVRGAIDDELRGKNLCCWCRLCPKHEAGKPLDVTCTDCAPCHVDPLGRLANNFACEAA